MKRNAFIVASLLLIVIILGFTRMQWLNRKNAQELARTEPLRVLCAQDWLSTGVLEKFSNEHHIRIQLWTYATPSEFLRQMANSDSKVDVVCTSSLLVKSLIRNHWLRKDHFHSLANGKLLAVDFAQLPYDPQAEYSVPLFWNLYGLFGKKGKVPPQGSGNWKQVWDALKISVWRDELNVLNMFRRLNANAEHRLQKNDEATSGQSVEEDLRHFGRETAHFIPPSTSVNSAEAVLGLADWVQLPLSRVAHFLGDSSSFDFWLPEDGGTLEISVLAIGGKSAQPALALKLIDDLISTQHAEEVHARQKGGMVHASFSNLISVASLVKPEALRGFPLNRLDFPDLDVESLPRFQKIFDEIQGRE